MKAHRAVFAGAVVLLAACLPDQFAAVPRSVSDAGTSARRSIYAPALLGAYRRSMEIESDIERACATYGTPVILARAVCMYESGASDGLVSSDGARGFFQVMPPTFRLMGVSTNIEAGVKYLSWLLKDYGREDDALAAYNGGPGRMKSGRLPIETVQYVVGVGIYKTLLSREEGAIRTDASRLKLHRVGADEDWDALAARTKVPAIELKLYNPYYAARPLRAGFLVAYPPVSEGSVLESSSAEPGPSSYYMTRRGDNYLMLAFAFDVELEQFRSDNALWRIQVPFEGMRMLITPKVRSASPGAAPTGDGTQVGASSPADARARPTDAAGAAHALSASAAAAPPTQDPPHGAPDDAGKVDSAKGGPTSGADGIRSAGVTRAARTIVHRVRRGETLTRIASRYGVSVEAIRDTNDLRRARIVVGQRLKIPID